MIEVKITENDIVRAIKSHKESPYEIALCRVLNCELDRLDIKRDQIKLWLFDDSDYASFDFATDEDKENFIWFKDQWDAFNSDPNLEFEEDPLTFFLEENSDPRTESRYWTATSVDFSQFTDRPSSDKKNPKFRLTDDDE
jgi:hypothetical protein